MVGVGGQTKIISRICSECRGISTLPLSSHATLGNFSSLLGLSSSVYEWGKILVAQASGHFLVPLNLHQGALGAGGWDDK